MRHESSEKPRKTPHLAPQNARSPTQFCVRNPRNSWIHWTNHLHRVPLGRICLISSQKPCIASSGSQFPRFPGRSRQLRGPPFSGTLRVQPSRAEACEGWIRSHYVGYADVRHGSSEKPRKTPHLAPQNARSPTHFCVRNPRNSWIHWTNHLHRVPMGRICLISSQKPCIANSGSHFP